MGINMVDIELEASSIVRVGEARKDLLQHLRLFRELKEGKAGTIESREVEYLAQANACVSTLFKNSETMEDFLNAMVDGVMLPFILLMEDYDSIKDLSNENGNTAKDN